MNIIKGSKSLIKTAAAFVAAVFGGIGSIPGAMIGGILLGIIENLSKATGARMFSCGYRRL